MKKATHYIEASAALFLFGGKAALAKVCGVTRAMSYIWAKDKYIPLSYNDKVIAAAKKHKTKLDKAYNKIIK